MYCTIDTFFMSLFEIRGGYCLAPVGWSVDQAMSAEYL